MKQTTSRHQFTFYHSYIDCVMALPKCRRFETLLALIFYALDGEEPQLSGPSEAVFRAIRPNVDSSRSKAEAVLRTREKAQGEQEPRPGETAPESAAEAKAKAKKKFKSESENETETEKEKEIESSALAAPGGRSGSAAGDGFSELSLSAAEREAMFFSGGEPEVPAPYAPLMEDACVRLFWQTWLNKWPNGVPPTDGEQEALLKTLQATAPGKRVELLIARIRAADRMRDN